MSIDKQRARQRFRSWHRGTREMDLLLGSFADQHLAAFTDDQISEYEQILEHNDPDLYNWMVGKEAVPSVYMSSVMKLLCAHKFKDA